MKKFKKPYLIFGIVLVFSSAVLLAGCRVTNNTSSTNNTNNTNNTSGSGNNKTYSISDYYPFTANLKTVYEGKGNEFASKTEYVDYIKGDKIQIRSDNGGTVSARVLQNKDGELTVLNSESEIYYKQDMTSVAPKKSEVLLKEPLVKGTSWTLEDGTKRSITGVNVDITTPLGSYKALEVTTQGSDNQDIDYYVINMGLVKSVYKSGGSEISSSLKEYIKNTPLVQNVKLYNFKVTSTDIQVVYKGIPVNLKTNEEIKDVFQNYFRQPLVSGTMALMSKNTVINSLSLNTAENKVYVDFSKQFVTEMNAGTTKETGVLRTVTDTLGNYYGVENVVITLDGQPYVSGHILMNKGEAFKTDFTGAIQVN
jgi:hypothetical protein